ncbi:NAD-dependent epimerase/dehydratase family protein [Microbacterium sp. CH-015]|uniref:NAD-dependent epimerase/dehydratase family protein n=1 Tax=Microbacterium sp. CH-015 TaxID=3406734 RepID=UPI003C793A8C
MSNNIHAVIGATGATGRVIVRELNARGTEVRAVSRRVQTDLPAGVASVAADALDAASLRKAVEGASVVYHCVMPTFENWQGQFPRITRAIIEAAGAVGARVVFADDTWMYGKVDGPMSERTAESPVSHKGVLRAWLGEMLLTAHHRGDAEVTIGRAPELFGPHVGSLLNASFIGAAARGKRPIYIGNPDLPITPMFIDDFARGLIALAEADDSTGRVWMIPTPAPTTARELVQLAIPEKDRPVRFSRISSRTGKALGLVWPLAREGAEMIYQFEQPFVIDASDFTTRFEANPTPYAESVRITANWYRRSRTA